MPGTVIVVFYDWIMIMATGFIEYFQYEATLYNTY